MGRDAAVETALVSVITNSLYNQDWLLPGWHKAVTNEIYQTCPQYMK
jgi:hypothetical protein